MTEFESGFNTSSSWSSALTAREELADCAGEGRAAQRYRRAKSNAG
ncbi:MAG: hypothetical protein AAB654_18500 [Acidobacteriota bacterium]